MPFSIRKYAEFDASYYLKSLSIRLQSMQSTYTANKITKLHETSNFIYFCTRNIYLAHKTYIIFTQYEHHIHQRVVYNPKKWVFDFRIHLERGVAKHQCRCLFWRVYILNWKLTMQIDSIHKINTINTPLYRLSNIIFLIELLFLGL